MAFNVTVVSANFTRPADTSAYTSGDLVANSTSAPAALSFSGTALSSGGAFMVRRARLKKSTTSTTAASFRLHLYGADPGSATGGITNGDNGAWLTDESTYIGSIDLDISGTAGRVFNDGAKVVGAPSAGTELAHKLSSGTTAYGLLEARGAYTPGSAEVFTVELEVVQN